MKKKYLIILIALLLILNGCVWFNPDSTEKMIELQKKHSFEEGYNTNQVLMNEYISSLAEIKKNSSPYSTKLIEAEIYLAESFMYYDTALGLSEEISFPLINCRSQETKTFIEFVELTNKSITVTEQIYSTLSGEQKEKLRKNYFELMEEIKENALLMKEFVEKKC